MKLLRTVFYAFVVLGFMGTALGDGEGGDLGSQTAAGGASPGTRSTLSDGEGGDLGSQTAAGGASPGTESTLGDGEGGDLGFQTAAGGVSAGTETRLCPFVPDDEFERSITPGYVEMGYKCLNVINSEFQRLRNVTTIKDFRNFFKNYCQGVPTIKECLAEVSTTSQACQNQTRHHFYQMFSDIMESIVDIGCTDDGDHLAIVFHGIVNGVRQNDIVLGCLDATELTNSTMDTTLRSLTIYLQLKGIQQCLLTYLQGDNAFKNELKSFTGEILAKVKCIHPENQTIVPCETIVSETESICYK